MIVKATITREVGDSLAEVLRLVAETGRPVIIQGEEIEGIMLEYGVYQALLHRLEDLEDLRDAEIAHAEYLAGAGRPFEEFVAELKAERESGSVISD
jgi:hypothetical protein